ncbi:MAG: hypothetical protein QW334_02075 [Thermofilum sp.]
MERMVKIDLRGTVVTLHIITERGEEKLTLTNGKPTRDTGTGKTYHSALVVDNTIILEGSEISCIPFKALYVFPLSVKDALARLIGDEVYLSGISAVPEGKERAILEKLLE